MSSVRTSLNTAYLVLTAVVLGSIVLAIVMIKPLLQDSRRLKQERLATEATLREKQEFLRTVDRKRLSLQSQAADERLLAVALPAEDAIEDVMRILHQAAATAQGVLGKVQNTSVTTQRDFLAEQARGEATDLPASVIPLSMEVEFSGTYQQVRVFLEQLEKSPRLLDATTLAITRDSPQGEQLTLKMGARFYRTALRS